MEDYPRTLYRPGDGPSVLWGELVDIASVTSEDEEADYRRCGWLRKPSVAVRRSKRRQAARARRRWLANRLPYFITTAFVLGALIVRKWGA